MLLIRSLKDNYKKITCLSIVVLFHSQGRGGGGLPNVGYTGMCHRPGLIFHFQNPEQAPNFALLIQNRPRILMFYSRIESFLDNQKCQLLSWKITSPIPVFFFKSMSVF